jgi:hypothetical protein
MHISRLGLIVCLFPENSTLYMGNVYIYAWAIPICGTAPPSSYFPTGTWQSAFGWSYASVFQWKLATVSDYYLGQYSNATWSYGFLNGQFTLTYSNVDGKSNPISMMLRGDSSSFLCLAPNICDLSVLLIGTSKNCPGGINRNTTIYLQCNLAYEPSAPFLYAEEQKIVSRTVFSSHL